MFLRRAVVLGRGELGSAIAEAFASERDLEVTAAPDLDLANEGVTRRRVAECGVVVSAAPRPLAAQVLRAVIEAGRSIADAATPVAEALPFHERAVARQVAVCVGCDSAGLARLLGRDGVGAPAPDEQRLAALMAVSLARRLLTGDFRGHWGVWTPARLADRVGMAHGIAQDLRERGIQV
jgi:hypothetical protein